MAGRIHTKAKASDLGSRVSGFQFGLLRATARRNSILIVAVLAATAAIPGANQ